MPPRNSLATCLCSVALGFAGVAGAAPQPVDVMPAPAEVVAAGGWIAAPSELSVTAPRTSARLDAAMGRLKARWHSHVAAGAVAISAPPLLALEVDCDGFSPAIPTASEDESYSLDVGAPGAVLRAATDIGALRGMETLLQLLTSGRDVAMLPVVSIRDQPRFPWRGLMIDVARRWQPTEVIERNIDAMGVVKLNVLHLHLTDDQGFRIESLTHPELQGQGSDGRYFTQAQMRTIIAYAAERGIRVVPEFDIPGHATSWVVSHPELASLPGPYGIERQWGVFNPVLDPTKEATYALLADFLGEMADLFPDRFIHIGGDENNGVQWSASPSIQAFIRAHGLAGNAGVHSYFNGRVAAILARHGKRIVGWDEILNPALPRDSVIDSWRGPEALATAAASGLDGILSNGFYIDLCYPASDHYASDPLPAGSTLAPGQRAHVLGGEATMWAEWVTPETIDSRIWPRTAAVAERLWSPAGVTDAADMYRRLAIVSGRLTEAGSLHERNRDVMLRHLVGENLGAPGVDALRTFISLIEPVKHYQRGRIQVWDNQLMPLVGLADAASPESDAARGFAVGVDHLLFGTRAVDAAEAARLKAVLAGWSAAAAAIGPLADTCPAVREAIPGAVGLARACSIGAEALDDLSSGTALSADKLAADLGTLDLAGAANESATELPALNPIRLLVAAAAREGARAGTTAGAWRAGVTEAARVPPQK
jgi:hexosaminidase